jgi:hypothetical protein
MEEDQPVISQSAYTLEYQIPTTTPLEVLEPPGAVEPPALTPPAVLPPAEGTEPAPGAPVSETPVSAAPPAEPTPVEAPPAPEREAPMSPRHPGHSDDGGAHSDAADASAGKKGAPILWPPGASGLTPGGAATPAVTSKRAPVPVPTPGSPGGTKRAAVPAPTPGSAGRGAGTRGSQTARKSALARTRGRGTRGGGSGAPPPDGA